MSSTEILMNTRKGYLLFPLPCIDIKLLGDPRSDKSTTGPNEFTPIAFRISGGRRISMIILLRTDRSYSTRTAAGKVAGKDFIENIVILPLRGYITQISSSLSLVRKYDQGQKCEPSTISPRRKFSSSRSQKTSSTLSLEKRNMDVKKLMGSGSQVMARSEKLIPTQAQLLVNFVFTVFRRMITVLRTIHLLQVFQQMLRRLLMG